MCQGRRTYPLNMPPVQNQWPNIFQENWQCRNKWFGVSSCKEHRGQDNGWSSWMIFLLESTDLVATLSCTIIHEKIATLRGQRFFQSDTKTWFLDCPICYHWLYTDFTVKRLSAVHFHCNTSFLDWSKVTECSLWCNFSDRLFSHIRNLFLNCSFQVPTLVPRPLLHWANRVLFLARN